MERGRSNSWGARVRRAWIERKAHGTGKVTRREISEMFGVSFPCASHDIAGVLREAPGSLVYDATEKAYLWGGGEPRLPVPEPIARFRISV